MGRNSVGELNRSYRALIIEGMGTETYAARMAGFDNRERWCRRALVLAAVWALAVVVVIAATGESSNTRWFSDPIVIAVCALVYLGVIKAKRAAFANVAGSEVERLNNLYRHSR